MNVHKKTLPRPEGLVRAAGKVCRSLSGAWELQGRVWGVLAPRRHSGRGRPFLQLQQVPDPVAVSF